MQEQLNQAEQELPELKKQLEQAQQKIRAITKKLVGKRIASDFDCRPSIGQ